VCGENQSEEFAYNPIGQGDIKPAGVGGSSAENSGARELAKHLVAVVQGWIAGGKHAIEPGRRAGIPAAGVGQSPAYWNYLSRAGGAGWQHDVAHPQVRFAVGN